MMLWWKGFGGHFGSEVDFMLFIIDSKGGGATHLSICTCP